MYRFSYLITYREIDQNRLNNLRYILYQLSLDPTLEIILVEQDVEPHFPAEQWPDLVYVFVENPGLFNKSWGLNIAASHATCDRLIFADSDMLIEAVALDEISRQMDNGADAINPYNVLIDLSPQESLQLLAQQNHLQIHRSQEQLNRESMGQHPPFCGGVFAITRKLYALTGGFDERFEGWGGEDDAMSKRVAHFALKTVTLNLVAYHLWHKPSEHDTNPSSHYIRNLSLLTMYYERQSAFYLSLAQTDPIRNASVEKYKSTGGTAPADDPVPLISCLCVTRGRAPLLSRAIKCFQSQSYEFKELIVICETDDMDTLDYLETVDAADIRYYAVPDKPKLSLGELRNLSIQRANGQFICQWDDDDWYHPDRLARQLEFALGQNKAASVLPRWLIHQHKSDKVFCSNIRLWEGSLLCRKSVLPASGAYDKKAQGEDSKLIETLFIEDQIAIEDSPDLYVYCINNHNTWNEAHFERILGASIELDPFDADTIKQRIAI